MKYSMFQPLSFVQQSKVFKQLCSRADGANGVGDVLALDVWCTAVDWLNEDEFLASVGAGKKA